MVMSGVVKTCPRTHARELPGQLSVKMHRTLGEIAARTGIPKTTLHRYLTPEPAREAL